MAVAHEIADQPLVVAHRLGTLAVGHAGGLHDRGIVAHVVDHPDEAVVEDGENLVQPIFQRRGCHPRCRTGEGAEFFDLQVDLAVLVCAIAHNDNITTQLHGR